MALRPEQLVKLARVLDLARANPFYAAKYAGLGFDPFAPANFARLPFATKAEVVADQAANPPYGSNFSRGRHLVTRLHQSSGTTTGVPMRWGDTAESWASLLNCWSLCFPLIGVTPADRCYFPFSFGPFLGFWTAFESCAMFGCLVVPGGGLTSLARLRMILDHAITVVFATPTYALHLAELAAAEGIDLAGSAVRLVVVAGEPGGSVPGTRSRIEQAWGARLSDHYGLTEVGPVTAEPEGEPGVQRVLESEYVAEVLTPGGDAPAPPGELGELVLTNLTRPNSPLIRYRTGDLVRALPPDSNHHGWLRLDGGVLGRADEMLHVRGNNLYPSAIEAVVRRFPSVAEYQVRVDRRGALVDLEVAVEPTGAADAAELVKSVARALYDALLFKVAVVAVPPGSLPRFEMKARRVVPWDRGDAADAPGSTRPT